MGFGASVFSFYCIGLPVGVLLAWCFPRSGGGGGPRAATYRLLLLLNRCSRCFRQQHHSGPSSGGERISAAEAAEAGVATQQLPVSIEAAAMGLV